MKMKKIFAALLALMCFASLVACGESEQFGLFDSDGESLFENAQDEITADAARQLITQMATEGGLDVTGSKAPAVAGGMPLPTDKLVNGLMAQYSSCSVTTTYYNEEGTQEETKVLRGEELMAMLSQNTLSPFSDFTVKYVTAFPELINYMEAQNQAFTQSEAYIFAPVKSLFSYYTDADGNLVVHINNFENLKLSEGMAGGVNSEYRQQIELVYDETNKLISWQASMGVVTKFPQGDLANGCVMKADFAWEEKN